MNSAYKICTRCIMNSSVPGVFFSDKGFCNYCTSYYNEYSISRHTKEKILYEQINEIKSKAKKKKYDSILAISGGTDSSYLALIAKQYDLKPLVVHVDNGWNSELAVKNIENIITKLNYDLYTYVIDWEEFKDIQKAYLYASVLDLEAPTDHAIIAALYNIADKHGIKYILLGTNHSTEAILPDSFRYAFKNIDAKNIKAIHKQFGVLKKIKTFPYLGVKKYFYYKYIKKIKIVSLLDFFEYDKEKAKANLIAEFGWQDYGGKHHESIITRFYQGYILPVKFNIDKRLAHYSTLICSGQMTRDDALEELKKPHYDTMLMLKDREFFIKKMGLTESEFELIMKLPIRKHEDFPSEKKLFDSLLYIKKFLDKVTSKKKYHV